jgi:hypothetical protein
VIPEAQDDGQCPKCPSIWLTVPLLYLF